MCERSPFQCRGSCGSYRTKTYEIDKVCSIFAISANGRGGEAQRRKRCHSRVVRSTAKAKEAGQVSAESSPVLGTDRKSTRLNSSHTVISYAVFCLKKKKTKKKNKTKTER